MKITSQPHNNKLNFGGYFKAPLYFIAGLLICSCNQSAQNKQPIFELLSPERTNITFSNDLEFTQESNIYRYRNYYNGGGVALGDINHDGLIDLFLTANMKKNRLYINQGNMQFKDITDSAGIAGTRAWSTGVSMVDINGDGLLDIYVCNSGIIVGDDKKNELFINNGDHTFSEKAADFNIDDSSMSIHASFFDYDRDGDLDMYLVNNSIRMIGSFDQEENARNIRNKKGGDRLYRNDGDGFTDVSEEAGIYGSEIGFGLGVSVADVNRDEWPDMYISNDFFERDYLYINNRDGTFSEVLEKKIKSVSAAAMGADVGDLNGDGYPEIFVTDMLPEPESRLKKLTTFDSWERYRKYVRDGYYHQFTRNTLQLNNTDGTFSEIGRYAGVEATDWSWGANIADFDLDGRRDIFVANGMYHDITNIDYLKFASREDTRRKIIRDSTVNFLGLIENIPSTPISNYAFKNMGNMKFVNYADEWGINQPSFSNGSAYGDLDNDGDLELVLNNLNNNVSVYRNNAAEMERGHWLKIAFAGGDKNRYAIGAQVTAWADGQQWYAEQMPVRGFQSTVDHRMHLGLGKVTMLDSLIVEWPERGRTKLNDVKVNQTLEINADSADPQRKERSINTGPEEWSHLVDITSEAGVSWKHKESEFNDFSRDPLLFHMRSAEGPPVCSADANGDGLDDFYAGGAKGQSGVLFLQKADGSFVQETPDIFTDDSQSEDTTCEWFDANGDGHPDLYVGSGSNEFPASSAALADRLYINRGNATFTEKELGVPDWRYKTTGSVSAADFDQDGDKDLFIGIRLQAFGIGLPTGSYLLQNQGNAQFKDLTKSVAPAMDDLGMVTDSKWGDIDGDGDADLIVTGEWMAITIFENEEGKLSVGKNLAPEGLATGWWNSFYLDDLDEDGDLDFIAGNHGENSRFYATEESPLEVYVNDFDSNGKIEQILAGYKQDTLYPYSLKHDLLAQLSYLEEKYPDYESFAGESVSDIFSAEKLQDSYHMSITNLKSVVGWNDGKGNFDLNELPMQAQLSTVNASTSVDANGDGIKEIFLSGNMYYAKPEVGGYDAGYGTVLSIQGDSLINVSHKYPGFTINGQVSSIGHINLGTYGPVLLVAENDDSLRLFQVRKGR